MPSDCSHSLVGLLIRIVFITILFLIVFIKIIIFAFHSFVFYVEIFHIVHAIVLIHSRFRIVFIVIWCNIFILRYIRIIMYFWLWFIILRTASSYKQYSKQCNGDLFPHDISLL